MHENTIPTEVAEGLQELGMSVVDVPQFILAHPEITHYVNPPTPIGVLKALETRLYDDECLSEGKEAVKNLPASVKRALRKFFASASFLSENAVHILRALPIFETTSQSEEPEFVSAKDVSYCTPRVKIPVHIPATLIEINCDIWSLELGEQLGVTECTLSEVLLDSIIPAISEGSFYDDESIDRLTDWLSHNLNETIAQSDLIVTSLREVPFVLNAANQRLKACELYNPTSEKLRKLFAAEDRFPVGVYARGDVVVTLELLGLLDYEKVSVDHIMEAATTVQSLSESIDASDVATTKAFAVLQWLDENASKILNVTNFEDVRFVPCLQKPPVIYPKHMSFKTAEFAFPKDVLGDEFTYLVGSVVPLVSTKHISRAAKLFGWTEEPALPIVLEQFCNVISNYQDSEKSYFEEIVHTIYQYLSKRDYIEVNEAIMSLKMPWVWHGNGFAFQDRVLTSTSQGLDLHPYLYTVPEHFNEFEPLLSQCGVQEFFTKDLLVTILQEIRDKWVQCQTIHPFEDYAKDKFIVLQILEHIKPDFPGELSDHVVKQLLLPLATTNGRLEFAFIEECTYCEPEEQWLYDQYIEFEGANQKLKFVHPDIPKRTIELLEVPSLSKQWVEADDAVGFEQAGQQEPLTRRIHRLLQEYSDGLSIPKEIIQNADDAGANVVKFLYDRRQHSDSRTQLLDRGMATCQGPALFAYNDAVFSDEDFVNITKLSGATKKEKTEKIGHFGLGFNSLYNITDLPSIVSRNYVLILDPTTMHLGRQIRDKTKPGIKINTRKRYLNIFDNQFKPYHGVFGCCLSGDAGFKEFDGTLIRLPLRTVSSEICDKCYTDSDMIDLLSILAKEANTLLLFTQSVKRVEIYLQEDNSTLGPVKLMCVSKAPVLYVREFRSPSNITNCDRFTQQCSVLRASSFKLKELKATTDEPQPVIMDNSVVLQMSCKVNKEGRDFFREQTALGNTVMWLVCSVMGGKDALNLAKSNRSLVPCAAVAIPLEKVEKTEDNFIPCSVSCPENPTQMAGAIFCYLPLPIVSGLPVHVNGSFAVTPSRRHLIERVKSDKPDIRVEWNEAMMETITLAYLRMLSDVKKLLPPGFTGYQYYQLFPLPTHGLWKLLGNCFYRYIATSHKAALCSDGSEWASLDQCVFLDTDIRCTPGIGDTALTVLRLLAKNMKKLVIDMPPEIYHEFVNAGCRDEVHVSMYTQIEFFTKLFLPAIAEIPDHYRNPLVIFALDTGGAEIKNYLKDCNCIPATPHGKVLMQPSQLFHPEGAAAQLFSLDDGRFPFGTKDTYCSPQRLETLCQLGMSKDYLSPQDIVNRAASVSKLCAPLEAFRQCRLLLSHLENNPDLLNDAVDLSSIPFVPVLQRPENHPTDLPWGGDTVSKKFLSPNQLWLASTKNTVGLIKPTVDDKTVPFSDAISRRLSFRSHPEVEDVAKQLRIICEAKLNLKDKKNAMYVQAAFREAYTLLQQNAEQNNDKFRMACKILEDQPFIIVGNNLLKVSQVAFEWSTSLPPYLFELPLELRTLYKDFFEQIGVKHNFDYYDFMKVLQYIQKQYKQKRLSEPVSNIVVTLIRLLAVEMKSKLLSTEDIERDCGPIMLLDNNGFMQPRSMLCFNDCPWVPDDASFLYVSNKLDYHTASVFGVRTKKRENILRIAEGFKLPFGQREKLTSRIKRILTGYNEEDEILKEMLQNADDAGATEIAFINDCRQLDGDHLLDDNWRIIQGPSLCVYNNAPFRQSDIVGIQNLGEGSKATDAYKMGRYGVGFNVVYKVTDVPTFLTNGAEIGECLCALDPHAAYLSGTTQDTTGMMLRINDSVREIYKDMFDCYLCDKFQIMDATMFRLPLRNWEMAQKSKISTSETSNQDLSQMFQVFKSHMLDILLFTNNVKKVRLLQISRDGNEVEDYTVTASLAKEDEHKKMVFVQHVNEISRSLREGRLTLEEVQKYTVKYAVHIKDNKGTHEDWLVIQQIGFDPGTLLPDAVKNAFHSKDLTLLPLAGTAAKLPSRNSFDVEPAVREHKVFCFLPLPCSADLPVHVNGQFILDHEARRRLEDGGGFQKAWNMVVIENVVAACYVVLMSGLRSECDKELKYLQRKQTMEPGLYYKQVKHFLQTYTNLFPAPGLQQNTFWKGLSNKVYNIVFTTDETFLPVMQTAQHKYKVSWHSAKDVHFKNELTEQSTENRITISDLTTIDEILIDIGFQLAECPFSVYEGFTEAGVDARLVTPEAVTSFLRNETKNFLLPNAIEKTPLNSIQRLCALINYCKNYDMFFESLSGTPLLLTNENTLQNFSSEHKVYLSEFSDLLPMDQNIFLHSSLVTYFQEALDVPSPLRVFQKLTPEDIAMMINHVLDETIFFDQKYVRAEATIFPWLKRLWKYLRKCVNDDAACNIGELLRPIEKWCLLPVRQHNCNGDAAIFLVQIAHANQIIDLRVDTTPVDISQKMKTALGVLKVPELYISETYDESEDIPEKDVPQVLCSNLTKADGVLQCLNMARKDKILDTEFATPAICSDVLLYFSQNIAALDLMEDSDEMLRALPLHQTIGNTLVSIEDSDTFLISSHSKLLQIEQSWIDYSDVTFLVKQNHKLIDLYNFLDCPEMEPAELYISHVLKLFHHLSPVGVKQHMEYIKDKVWKDCMLSMGQKGYILQETLKKLHFLPDSNGKLFPASHFYDPKVKVFHMMLGEEKFPPAPYKSNDWLTFLRNIGIQSSVNCDMFLEFVKKVANEAVSESASEETEEKSVALVSYLYNNILVSHDFSADELIGLLTSIKDIKFLAPGLPDDDLQELMPAYGQENKQQYIAFNGSTCPDYSRLLWSVCTILPPYANPTKHYSARLDTQSITNALGVTREPTNSTVASNLTALVSHISDFRDNVTSETELKLRVKAVTDHFRYLKEHAPLDNETRMKLSWTKCIPVEMGRTFVEPTKIVVELAAEDEIPPFLYKIPLHMGPFSDILLQLGAAHTVTVKHYVQVLQNLYDETKFSDSKLHPNECILAFKAMKKLLFSVKDGSASSISDLKRSTLYLPSNSLRMYRSTDLVFNDKPSFKAVKLNREYVIGLKECGIDDNDQEYWKLLPEEVRPKMFSDLVEETLLSDIDTELSCCSTHFPIKRMLITQSFQLAVLRLLIHELTLKGKPLENADNLECDVVECLSTLTLHCVNELRIGLTYRATSHEIPDTAVAIPCFVEKSKENSLVVIYINHKKELKGMIEKAIANFICEHFKQLDNYKDILHVLLSNEDNHMLILDQYNIKKDDDEDEESESASLLPKPGDFIPVSDHHLLQQDLNRWCYFSPGEYVGFEVDCEEDTPIYLYAVVLEVIKERRGEEDLSAVTKKYRIDIGQRAPVIAMATDIYKFTRPERLFSDQLVTYKFRGDEEEKLAKQRQFADTHTEKKKKTLEQLKREVTQTLEDSWILPDAERKKIQRRLYLTWHPDKNPDDVATANAVFKHLQEEIKRIEKRKEMFSTKTWDTWAKMHQQQREKYKQHMQEEYDKTDSAADGEHEDSRGKPRKNRRRQRRQKREKESDFTPPPTFTKKNPQPGEAKRWYKQAADDLRAVYHDLNSHPPSNMWACFKAHQVCIAVTVRDKIIL